MWGTENAGTKNVRVVLVTDGVYSRYMKSGEQPGGGLKMIATKKETKQREHDDGDSTMKRGRVRKTRE